MAKRKRKKLSKGKKYISKRMREFSMGKMRTGVGGKKGRRGAVVKDMSQALAIAHNEARDKGYYMKQYMKSKKRKMMM